MKNPLPIIHIMFFLQIAAFGDETVVNDIYRFDNKSSAGDDWMDGQNWRNQTADNAKGKRPDKDAVVRFNFAGTGGTLSSDAGTILRLQIGADDLGGSLILNPGARLVISENESYIGWNGRGEGGSLIVNGGMLEYNGWVSVANEGKGTLILNAGTIRVANTFFHNIRNGGGPTSTWMRGGMLDVNKMILNSGIFDLAGGVVRIRAGTSAADIQNWINKGLLRINGSDSAVKDFHYTLTPWGQSGIEIRIKPAMKPLGLIGA